MPSIFKIIGINVTCGALKVVLGGGQAQEYASEPVAVAAAPEKQKPVAAITSNKVTVGMTTLSASLTFDAADEGNYALYRFTEDTLDEALANGTATKLSSGTLYRSQTSWSLYMGTGKIAAGDKLQVVLQAGGVEGRSNVMTVEPSPDWGTPYVAFNTSAVQVGATSIRSPLITLINTKAWMISIATSACIRFLRGIPMTRSKIKSYGRISISRAVSARLRVVSSS